MSNKPTYEDLEQRVKELEQDAVKNNQLEEALQESERELTIRNRIAEIFLTTPGDKIYFELLQVILEAMKSPFGTISYINEHGDRVLPVLTRDIWVECEVQHVDQVFPRERWSGIWGRCLVNKETVSGGGLSRFDPVRDVFITYSHDENVQTACRAI